MEEHSACPEIKITRPDVRELAGASRRLRQRPRRQPAGVGQGPLSCPTPKQHFVVGQRPRLERGAGRKPQIQGRVPNSSASGSGHPEQQPDRQAAEMPQRHRRLSTVSRRRTDERNRDLRSHLGQVPDSEPGRTEPSEPIERPHHSVRFRPGLPVRPNPLPRMHNGSRQDRPRVGARTIHPSGPPRKVPARPRAVTAAPGPSSVYDPTLRFAVFDRQLPSPHAGRSL